jgi:single-stranded DNA-binding protein
MTVAVLISGSIFKAPEERMSKAGRRFVSATIKVGGESGTGEFWACLAFSDSTQAELLRLGIGDTLSAQGSAKIELYTANDGKTKISRTVFADHVLALRQPPKERKAKAAKAPTAQETTTTTNATPEETAAGGPAFFSDDIPFECAR